MASAGAYRSVLAIRDARLLITASAASQLGNWLYNAALLAYVYIATESAAWVGAATICRLLPYVLLARMGSYRTADAAGIALILAMVCLGLTVLSDLLGRGGAE